MFGLPVSGVHSRVSLQTLEGQWVNPLRQTTAKATVFVFISTDCPLANSYAPEINRIYTEYSSKRIAFQSVYEDEVTARFAKAHARSYGYRFSGMVDTHHDFAATLGALVTPECVVVGPSAKILYRGRIDNTYASVSRRRGVTTIKDLRAALSAITKGEPVSVKETTAIGCAIPSKNWKLE
jgi:hypothetical protein